MPSRRSAAEAASRAAGASLVPDREALLTEARQAGSDAAGKPIVTERPVVRVGIDRTLVEAAAAPEHVRPVLRGEARAVILDRHDNLYAGSRHGDIMRFLAPDYQKMEVFAHIGGQPLGPMLAR